MYCAVLYHSVGVKHGYYGVLYSISNALCSAIKPLKSLTVHFCHFDRITLLPVPPILLFSIGKLSMICVMIFTGQKQIYGRVSAKYDSLSKYLFSQNSELYAELVCFVNHASAFEPNLGTKSANVWTCVSGIMSPKGALPA